MLQARYLGGAINRLSDLGSGLAEIVAPLDEDDDYDDEGLSDQSIRADENDVDMVRTPAHLYDKAIINLIDIFLQGMAAGQEQYQHEDGKQQEYSIEIAHLKAALNDKTDEVQGLENQLTELKNIIRSNSSGSMQLVVEALQGVYSEATNQTAPSAVHRLIAEQSTFCERLEGFRRIAKKLHVAQQYDIMKGESTSSVTNDEEALKFLRAFTESFVAGRQSGGSTTPNNEGSSQPIDELGDTNIVEENADEAVRVLEKQLYEARKQLEYIQQSNGDLSTQLENAKSNLGKEKQGREDAERHAAEVSSRLHEMTLQQEQQETAHMQSPEVHGDMEAAQKELTNSLAAKEHEIAQLKEIISQLRTSKKTRAQEAEVTTRERNELLKRVQAQSMELEEALATNGELRRTVRLNEERGQDCNILSNRIAELERAAVEEGEARAKVEGELQGKLNAVTQRHLAAQQSEHESSARLRVAEADLQLARQDHQRSSTAAANLQKVLEQFQLEKKTEIDQIRERMQKQINATAEASDIKLEHVRKAHAEDLSSRERIINDLREKTEKNNETYEIEKKSLQKTLDNAISQLSSQRGDVVDKRLAASLVVQYVSKKFSMEVLALLARIFSFTEEEQVKVGLRKRQMRLRGIGGGNSTNQGAEDAGLAELWVRFLNEEAGEGEGGLNE